MRNPSPIVALVAALLTFGPGASAQTQPQSQPAPDAPQPQKKPAPKAQPADSAPPPADEPAPSRRRPKTTIAFPEDVSRDAAKKADDSKPPTAKDNPFPEDVSKDAAKAASGDTSKSPQPKTIRFRRMSLGTPPRRQGTTPLQRRPAKPISLPGSAPANPPARLRMVMRSPTQARPKKMLMSAVFT